MIAFTDTKPYIMVERVYVMFSLILPSPCKADDIYIMMKCVYVCLSRFCLFCLSLAKLTIYR